MIRPTPLQRYILVMKQKGFSTSQILEGSGIDEAAIGDQQRLVDAGSYHRVVENIVRLTGDTGIGLDMGLSRELSDFRILGYAAQACRTVRQSVDEFWGPYGDALGMMSKLTVCDQSAQQVTLELQAADLSEPTYRFFVEEAWVLLVKLGSQINGEPARFESLSLAYPEPRYSARYREIFDCPLRFGAAQTLAVLSRRWLEQPLPTMDGELCQLYHTNLDQLVHQIKASSTLTSRLQELLLKQGGHAPALEEVARAFNMSPRTLRRRLQDEGTSFRQVVEQCRIDRTLDSLKSERLSAKQLSDRMGFDDVNAFRRAFKKWTGRTLSEYRS